MTPRATPSSRNSQDTAPSRFPTLTYYANAAGVVQEIVRNFTGPSGSGSIGGQAYAARETIDDAASAPLATVYHLDSGGELYVGTASDITAPTFGGSGVTPNTAELSYAIPGGDWDHRGRRLE